MTKRKTIALVFGTRPEAIKMAPLVNLLKKESSPFKPCVIVTAQHRQMLDQVLRFFDIQPDVDLNLMRPNQNLRDLTALAVSQLGSHLAEIRPDIVLVQGDTTTAFAGALAAFYEKIPVGHVEAGLRTNDLHSPFPEEANRRLISVISRFHFAPTQNAAHLLKNEGHSSESIFVSGNTVVDALLSGLELIKTKETVRNELSTWFKEAIPHSDEINALKRRLILITGHRRESFGEGFLAICKAVHDLAKRYPEDIFVYPVHLNPNVQEPVKKILAESKNVILLEPVDYPQMLHLLSKTYLILTDSGGIQEEAPSLKIPTLVMREKTERPEGVDIGAVALVGNRYENIFNKACSLLDDKKIYTSMQIGKNPYGDGKASENIINTLADFFYKNT